jgi:AraC-like DNA-binding protein
MQPWSWNAIEPVSVERAERTSYALAPRAWSSWCVHDLHVLEWIDAEGMQTRVRGQGGDRPFARPARRWHFYPAGTAYSEHYERPDRIHAHGWVFFRMRAAPPVLSGRAFAAIEDPEDRIGFCLRAMHAAQQRGEAHAGPQMHGLLWAAIGEVLTAAAAGGEGTPEQPWVVRSASTTPSDSLLARLDAVVTPRLTDPLSVPELAQRLQLSVSGLAHRLKAECGTTAVARIRWLRVREARRLLATGAGVKEVSTRLGFSNPTYFSRVFRAVAGVSPQDFQARLRPTAP